MNYQKIYNDLIEKRRIEKLEKNKEYYCETHHTIPRCMNGSDGEENLVNLYAREHFIAHLLLCKIYPENIKLFFAIWRMCNSKQKGEYKVSAREYEKFKTDLSLEQKKEWSGENNPMYGTHREGKLNPMFGRSIYSVWLEKYGKKGADKRAEEHGNKISVANSGENNGNYRRKISEEYGYKISQSAIRNRSQKGPNNGMYGKHHTGESKQKHKITWEEKKNRGYISPNKNKQWMNNGISNVSIKKEEVDKYKNLGYIFGMIKNFSSTSVKGRVIINNGIEQHEISPENLEEYERRGFKKGMLKIECLTCGKTLSRSNYKKYGHGESCKNKNIYF